MKKISIIMPMYNSERFIEKCISSLVSQTHENIEIIIIDDGSSDSSYDICLALSKNDSRIHLIKQVNGGVSAARNTGLKYATGDYIGFVDSDDYVTENMYASLLAAAEKYQADIVECGYFEADANGQITLTAALEADIIRDNHEMMKKSLSGWNTVDFCCNKLYEKSLFDGVEFPAYHYSEDYYVNYMTLAKSQTKVTLSEPHYFYVKHETNATSGNFNPRKMDVIKAGQAVLSSVEEDYPALKNHVIIYLLNNLIDLYMLILAGDRSGIRKNAPAKENISKEFKFYYSKLMNKQNLLLKDKIKFLSFRNLPGTSLQLFQLLQKVR